jgi:multimeric flavodoxin WrbA
MEKKLILGVSASPRKNANTDRMLKYALEAAESVGGIETDIIYLRDYDIHNCRGCFACCREPGKRDGGIHACAVYQDGMEEIYPKLKACDGLILASPVYFGSITAQMKQFMDRTEGLLRYGTSQYQYALQNKVGGCLAVGGNRNAGEEFTLLAMQYYFQVHDMIVVGSGGEPTPGCYLGGGCTTYPQKGDIADAIENDEIGLKSARNTGIKVAQTVLRFAK